MELFPRRGKEENSKIRPKNVREKRLACSCSAGHLLQVAVTAAVNSSQVRHHCRADARFLKPIFFLLFNLAQISRHFLPQQSRQWTMEAVADRKAEVGLS